MKTYVIAYDVGTTGVKTCLFSIGTSIELIASASQGYGLTILPDGGAEQNADEWWDAMCVTTARIFRKTEVRPEEIAGLSFCSQMQGVVVVDKEGKALRNPMSYMDQRSKEELKKGIAYGPQFAGANLAILAKSLYLTKAVTSSVKDPVWKYKWIEAHEPGVYQNIYKWLDVKEYLIGRCTGNFVMTEDSAYATLLYDTRKGHEGWSRSLCKTFGINMDHLPPVVKSTDQIGVLTEKAAAELGLPEGTPVFGGGGDASLIGVGAGAVRVGDTHIYSGTSGWVGTVVDRQVVDPVTMIASVVGAQPGRYHYFAEMETAAKCFEWVKDHLALDEVDIYLEKHDVTESHDTYEATYTSLYDFLSEVVSRVPAGSHGVIFTPWLHGNRCPFEDPNAAGMFFNLNIETGKSDLMRAVLEGIAFHLRWMLECEERKVHTSEAIRFVGGGALSPVTCQILADILNRPVETVDHPQNVGAVGAAAVAGVGLGLIRSVEDVRDFIPVTGTYYPTPENRAVYDRNYAVFQTLHKNNQKAFRALNGDHP